MRWLVWLSLFLLPIATSKVTQQEAKPTFWHSDHVYGHIAEFFWCRTKKKAEEAGELLGPVRQALFEQIFRAPLTIACRTTRGKIVYSTRRDNCLAGSALNEMLRAENRGENSQVIVEMVVLQEEEKYRDWDPIWIRKKEPYGFSRIRIFINEPSDSEVSKFCKTWPYPTTGFPTLVAISEFFYAPVLVCQFGVPTCDLGKMLLIIWIIVTFAIAFCVMTCSLWNSEILVLKKTEDSRQFGMQNLARENVHEGLADGTQVTTTVFRGPRENEGRVVLNRGCKPIVR
ncbi:uncharacterized protein CELE_C17E7.9 [Caenorhabditis elegans]|uniref:Uncharacterized protein n=1 Tax=Caenorhabditis elegans TaxID=6239 RepID=Q965M7_CAEEL|nr:Uncharacterized protein CELE_C17E7.9 [Caenorhabditis elegans]CCD64874.1 Uncharacterized protein CELE_C17E7.9 [Caenorhabditis elegans]|eukprot:NP_504073.1 Uncharacterized protein CELE_C17E7.9 [Caenorhabditis elegans]